MRLRPLIAGLVLAIGTAGLPALADDAADLALWTTVRDSKSPAEFQAYLNAFPNGRFAALARIRLQALRGGAPAPAPIPAPVAKQAAKVAKAVVTTTRPEFSAIDRIGVTVDARGLRSGSNHRLWVGPAATPDAVDDANAFAEESTAIAPSRLRMTLPPGPPGLNEVRLYFIPQFESRFTVAARAPVAVLAGAPGAVVVNDLTEEARQLGPVRFEAKHRDVPVRIEGQFLRMETRTTGPDWIALLRGHPGTETDYVAMYVGHLGTPLTERKGPREVLCLMPSDDRAVLNRLAGLNPGDGVLLDGLATTWRSVFGSDVVIFDPCRFAD